MQNVVFFEDELASATEDTFYYLNGLIDRYLRRPRRRTIASRARPIRCCLSPMSYKGGVVKLCDYGQSFFDSDPPDRLHHVDPNNRPPEDIFGDRLDHRADLWMVGLLVRLPLFLIYPECRHRQRVTRA